MHILSTHIRVNNFSVPRSDENNKVPKSLQIEGKKHAKELHKKFDQSKDPKSKAL